MENNTSYEKISDFPIEEKYPFSFEVENDIEDNLLCMTKDGLMKKRSFIKLTLKEIVNSEEYIVRDRKEFIKIYKDGLKAMLNLSWTAQKVLIYIMDTMAANTQYVDIVPKTCMEVCGFKTPKSVRDGIIELLNKDILKRNPHSMRYWLNPLLLFNGDRIEFVKSYVYKTNED